MGDWEEEVELQRRALALSAMSGAVGSWPGGVGSGGVRGVVPIWAAVARVQALQSLADKAPRNSDLRAALYEVNIPQVIMA